MENLKAEETLQRRIREGEILICLYGSGHCGPCGSLREKLDRWAAGQPGVDCLYIPIEDFPRLCGQEGIYTVPTVLVYVRSQLTVRESGYFSLEDILQKVRFYQSLL